MHIIHRIFFYIREDVLFIFIQKTLRGASAWTLDPDRGQYYLHHMSKEFPELNLHNEDVKKELEVHFTGQLPL